MENIYNVVLHVALIRLMGSSYCTLVFPYSTVVSCLLLHFNKHTLIKLFSVHRSSQRELITIGACTVVQKELLLWIGV